MSTNLTVIATDLREDDCRRYALVTYPSSYGAQLNDKKCEVLTSLETTSKFFLCKNLYINHSF